MTANPEPEKLRVEVLDTTIVPFSATETGLVAGAGNEKAIKSSLKIVPLLPIWVTSYFSYPDSKGATAFTSKNL